MDERTYGEEQESKENEIITKECYSCLYWDEDSREGQRGFGDCHRYPPNAVHTHNDCGKHSEIKCTRNSCEQNHFIGCDECWDCGIGVSFNPVTLEEDWCGEWRPREKSWFKYNPGYDY